MIAELRARLIGLAAQGHTISYGALAAEMALPSPAIAKLTAMLEALMIEDAQAGRPFLASVMAGRLGDGMPGLGFFEKAVALGAVLTADPAAFVAQQRAALIIQFRASDH